MHRFGFCIATESGAYGRREGKEREVKESSPSSQPGLPVGYFGSWDESSRILVRRKRYHDVPFLAQFSVSHRHPTLEIMLEVTLKVTLEVSFVGLCRAEHGAAVPLI